jgi:protein-tyrosine-phosphatase
METRMAYRSPRPSAPLARRSFIFGIGLALAAAGAKAGCPPVRVLFVCSAGSVKSAIARETFRRRAADQGVVVSVSSRGLHPEDHISPALAADLRRDGVDPRAEPLRALTPADIAQADLVIAFDEAAEAPLLHAARVWKTPSWNTDYAAAKADLDGRLALLLMEVRTRPTRPCEAR